MITIRNLRGRTVLAALTGTVIAILLMACHTPGHGPTPAPTPTRDHTSNAGPSITPALDVWSASPHPSVTGSSASTTKTTTAAPAPSITLHKTPAASSVYPTRPAHTSATTHSGPPTSESSSPAKTSKAPVTPVTEDSATPAPTSGGVDTAAAISKPAGRESTTSSGQGALASTGPSDVVTLTILGVALVVAAVALLLTIYMLGNRRRTYDAIAEDSTDPNAASS